MSWAETDEAALRGSREWKGTVVDEHYAADVHDPAEVGRNGDQVSDLKWKATASVSSDPASHVRRAKALAGLGASAVVLMDVSGTDPRGTVRTYGRDVLPALRG